MTTKAAKSTRILARAENVVVKLVESAYGLSLYVNDFRVLGGKPYGGGRVVRTWEVEKEAFQDDLDEALGFLGRSHHAAELAEYEGQWCAVTSGGKAWSDLGAKPREQIRRQFHDVPDTLLKAQKWKQSLE